MNDITSQINNAFVQMLGWELVAVILAIAYLVLIIRENALGWYCAFFSTLIYTLLFWQYSLLMESALNVYYMGMAIYGYWQWQRVGDQTTEHQKRKLIVRWPIKVHILGLVSIGLATFISGSLLSNNTSAALPYLDSLTSWSAVFATFLIAKKVLENWVYWIVIDSLSIYLYLDRGLYLTSLLFFAYTIMCFFGLKRWLKEYQRNLD